MIMDAHPFIYESYEPVAEGCSLGDDATIAEQMVLGWISLGPPRAVLAFNADEITNNHLAWAMISASDRLEETWGTKGNIVLVNPVTQERMVRSGKFRNLAEPEHWDNGWVATVSYRGMDVFARDDIPETKMFCLLAEGIDSPIYKDMNTGHYWSRPNVETFGQHVSMPHASHPYGFVDL